MSQLKKKVLENQEYMIRVQHEIEHKQEDIIESQRKILESQEKTDDKIHLIFKNQVDVFQEALRANRPQPEEKHFD